MKEICSWRDFYLVLTEEKLPPSGAQEEVQAEGFGKLYPSAQPDQEQDESSGGEEDPTSNVISRKELEKGRLSKHGSVESDWLSIVSAVGDNYPAPPKGFVFICNFPLALLAQRWKACPSSRTTKRASPPADSTWKTSQSKRAKRWVNF